MHSKAFRSLMGTFATGVTVVTTSVDGRLHGLTANSVTSVSLDPALLLVCVDKGATAHGELERASSFAVNILSAGQQDVSTLFASTAEPEAGSLRGVAFRPGETGAPLIEGALAYAECRVVDRLEAGDHTIVVGEAVAGEVVSDAAPLLFHCGKYRAMAPA